jgi:AraC-like DNA-binding protein
LLPAANNLLFAATRSHREMAGKCDGMKKRSTARLDNLPSAMGLVSRLAYRRARTRGVAVHALLERAGLTTELIEDPRSRIPVHRQIDFLNLVADALDDDLLGFHMAQDFELRSGGLYYYVLASSDTLADAFERGARFTSLVNEGVLQESVAGRRVGLALRYKGVKRQNDRHQIEFWMVALLRICRRVTGQQLHPVRIGVTHFRGPRGAKVSRYLGCKVEFGAAKDEMLFPRECGDLKLLQGDPFLNRLLIEMCEEALSQQRRAAESFAARVENAVAPLLPHGKASAANIAAELGMSKRTFARRLENENLTFSTLLDDLRLRLARRYLLNEELPVSQVAWSLGYSEVGAFSHAFRRWTGKSPRSVARSGAARRRRKAIE